MSQNTNDTFVTPITEKETLEFFSEGLRQASSAARQLAALQNHFIWDDVSKLLDEIHNSGVTMARSKPLSRFETLAMLDRRENRTVAKLDETRLKPKLIVN